MQRRGILQRIGAAVAVLIPVSVFGRSTLPDHEDAREEVEALATRINNTNLAIPSHRSDLTAAISESVEAASEGIDSSATESARHLAGFQHWLAEITAFLPGQDDPPERPSIEREIDGIKAAIDYYKVLEETLNWNNTLHWEIDNVERDILDPDRTPVKPPEGLIESMESHLLDLENETSGLDEENETLGSVLPDTETVSSDLHHLGQVYQGFVDAHRAYLDTSESIAEGAMHRERSELTAAKQSFHDAASTAAIEIPSELHRHSLYEHSPSLGNYADLLELIQSGATKLSKSTEGNDAESSNQSFNKGLDSVMEARAQIE